LGSDTTVLLDAGEVIGVDSKLGEHEERPGAVDGGERLASADEPADLCLDARNYAGFGRGERERAIGGCRVGGADRRGLRRGEVAQKSGALDGHQRVTFLHLVASLHRFGDNGSRIVGSHGVGDGVEGGRAAGHLVLSLVEHKSCAGHDGQHEQ
jgi:hypothetical protein